MNVTDEDMQMVRTWLEEAKAPFHIQSRFENLIEQHEKEAARVEELEDESARLEIVEEELKDAKEQVDALEAELDERKSDQDGALETVKYWLHDVLVLKRPMQKPPREILRLVEDVL